MDPRVVSAAKRTLRKESQEVHGKLRHVTSDELLPQVVDALALASRVVHPSRVLA